MSIFCRPVGAEANIERPWPGFVRRRRKFGDPRGWAVCAVRRSAAVDDERQDLPSIVTFSAVWRPLCRLPGIPMKGVQGPGLGTHGAWGGPG